MTTTAVASMRNEHEEADTRIVLHLQYINDQRPEANVVVRCNDTDVLIILIHHMKRFSIKVWMDTGANADNTRHYIDVTKLYKALPSMAEVLPAIHAFTGCDYTAAFMRKGKVKPYEKVEAQEVYRDFFFKFGQNIILPEGVVEEAERFVCMLYGKPKLSKLSEARYALFRMKYAPTKYSDPLEKIKGADSSTLPPSPPVLIEKLKHTNYVTYLWRNAHLQDPVGAADPAAPTCKILWAQRIQLILGGLYRMANIRLCGFKVNRCQQILHSM